MLVFILDGVFEMPVIAVRRLSGASHLVGFTIEWLLSQTTCATMPAKLWFPSNRGTNMTENAHLCLEKSSRRYPLRLGTFSTFGSWRLSVVCSPYMPVIAVRGLLGASHQVRFTVEGLHSQTTTCAAMRTKLWFLSNGSTNMTKNSHLLIEKASRRYPVGFVVHTSVS